MRQYTPIKSRPFSVTLELWDYPSHGVRYRGVGFIVTVRVSRTRVKHFYPRFYLAGLRPHFELG